ncbi:MAG: YicC family protein [Planctomycetota bacterium]
MTTVRSMTGYGSARFERDGVHYLLEIRAVNNRFLKLNFKLPIALGPIQESLRTLITRFVSRGSVDLFLRNADGNGENYSLNTEQIELYRRQINRFAPGSQIPVAQLLVLPGVASRSELVYSEELEDVILEAAKKALEAFNSSRESEALALVEDIKKRIVICSELVSQVEQLAPFVVQEIQKRLKERLSELANGLFEGDSEPLAREVAVIADKADVTEETVRLNKHMQRFSELLAAGGPVGKELDFIIQEMNREANTIGSKSSNFEIVSRVIALKTEIERIREQVQNIE